MCKSLLAHHLCYTPPGNEPVGETAGSRSVDVEGAEYNVADLTALYVKQAKITATLEEVRRLLAKADQRRLEDPAGRRHWDRVLDNLENSLQETRFRLEQCETAIRGLEQTLTPEEIARARARSRPRAGQAAHPVHGELSSDPEQAVREVMEMTVDELRELSMEQVASINAHLPEVLAQGSRDSMKVTSQLELANQLRHDAPPPAAPVSKLMEKRNHLLLRRSLHKTMHNRVADVTREEKKLISSAYEMLSRRMDCSPEDKRLCQVLEAAMRKLGML